MPRFISFLRRLRALQIRVCAAAMLMTATAAIADPGYYLVSVYDNEGERSIDFRFWAVKRPGSVAVIWPEIGFGYGVTTRWYTELYASFIGSAGSATQLSTLNWQNDFLLTQGQYPFDLAVHTNLISERYEPGVYTLEIGPAFQTDIDRTQLNANLFLERSYRSADASPTELKYQWQAKYRWKSALQFGLQGFGELGPWDQWSARSGQSHRAGPALSGRWPVGAGQSIRYEVAYLVGTTYASHGAMFSTRVQYVF